MGALLWFRVYGVYLLLLYLGYCFDLMWGLFPVMFECLGLDWFKGIGGLGVNLVCCW